MSLPLPLFPDPIAVFQNIASPVDVSVSLASIDFGPNAVVNMITTVTLKLTGEPIPYLHLDLLLNGQIFKQRLTTDTKGVVSQKVTLTDEGTYVFEALPSDLESFQSTFGPFIPKGSQTLTIYALTFQAFNSGLGKEMNVGLAVSGRSFQTPAKILSPQTHLSVVYPQIAQGVYSLDPNQLELDVRGDEAVIVRYNAPGSIVGNLFFDASCIPSGGTVSGVLNGTVKDIGGNPFPNVPITINGINTQTDLNGNFSERINATSPGTQSLTVSTLTPISISKTFQQNVPACPPPSGGTTTPSGGTTTPSSPSTTNQLFSGYSLDIDTEGHANAVLIIANSAGGFWPIADTSNGKLSILPEIDGNHLGILSTVQGRTLNWDLQPGSVSNSQDLNSYQWGESVQAYLVDSSIYNDYYAHQSPGTDFVAWLNQNFPGAYIGAIILKWPKPILKIRALSVSPVSAPPGVKRTYKGSGWMPSGTIIIGVGSSPPGNFLTYDTVDSSGMFSDTYLPPDAPGTYYVDAADVTGGVQRRPNVVASLEVTAPGSSSDTSDQQFVEIEYADSFGNPLDAVSNPVNFLVLSSGNGTFGSYRVNGGNSTYLIIGPFTIEAYIGTIYSSGAPLTSNTIVSNSISI